ncbi:hypothetical protein C0995_007544 [Termitomyces sp. Mi166|nr:hypothetical protein C0995_007544 [Termitomyces sp. Mi166\
MATHGDSEGALTPPFHTAPHTSQPLPSLPRADSPSASHPCSVFPAPGNPYRRGCCPTTLSGPAVVPEMQEIQALRKALSSGARGTLPLHGGAGGTSPSAPGGKGRSRSSIAERPRAGAHPGGSQRVLLTSGVRGRFLVERRMRCMPPSLGANRFSCLSIENETAFSDALHSETEEPQSPPPDIQTLTPEPLPSSPTPPKVRRRSPAWMR